MSNKAIVTGHSKGLGEALARQLSDDGWEVLGISRSAGEKVDLASPSALVSWLDTGAVSDFLDGAAEIILINNAAAVGPIAPAGTMEPSEVEHAINLNVTAPILLTDAVLRERPREAQVRVAHISSGAGRRSYTMQSVYCATKAAVDMHARTVADEAHDGVRIAAIAPGVVDTPMQASLREADPRAQERYEAMMADGTLASPEAAARRVLTLIHRDDFGSNVITDVRDAG